MIYAASRTLEDQVVENLSEGPSNLKRLYDSFRKTGVKGSLRAVYKAVSKLEKEGVVLKAGKAVRLNREWVQKLQGHLSRPLIGPLEAGEKAIYTFTSVPHLDRFWKTIAYELEHVAGGEGAYFYNPHNFWAYLPDRKESEEAYYQHFGRESRGFFVLGGASRGDSEFKTTYQNDFFQVDTREIASLPRNYHISVLGDYVITVKLPKEMSKTIDMFYVSGMKMSELLPKLEKMLEKPGAIRFVLENSPRKASKLRKLLSKNFYIPREAA